MCLKYVILVVKYILTVVSKLFEIKFKYSSCQHESGEVYSILLTNQNLIW